MFMWMSSLLAEQRRVCLAGAARTSVLLLQPLKSYMRDLVAHMRKLLMMLRRSHFVNSLTGKSTRMPKKENIPNLSKYRLTKARVFRSCIYVLWISKGSSEAFTIIAPRRGFKVIWTRTISDSIGGHTRRQSLMCPSEEWYFASPNTLNRAFCKCTLSA